MRNNLRVSPRHLEDLKRNRLLNIRIFRRGKVVRSAVEISSLQRVLEEEARYVTHKSAAKQLGIHPNSIPRLIQAKFLQEQNSPRGMALITRESVSELLRKCRGKFDERDIGILFHEALVKYSVNGLTLVRLISWIIDQKITTTMIVQGGSLKDLHLKESELSKCIQQWKATQQSEKGYTVEDVRVILRVSDRTIKKMIEKKVILPMTSFVGIDGRKHYFFDKPLIDEFVNSHVRVPLAAKMYNIPEQKLRKWVREGKLLNHTPGITRRPLLNKYEIEALLATQ